jgi:hypothetical protein
MGDADWSGRTRIFGVALAAMNSLLPATGTQALLETISRHIPDPWINAQFPQVHGRGRRRLFSSAQLWRVHLLALLTPVHSFNLLIQMLSEQKAWRRFAHLPNRYAVPEPWVLHEFRQRLGVAGLRQINEHLVVPLLPSTTVGRLSVALIDATDLPAATGFKKVRQFNAHARRWSAHAQDRPEPFFVATKALPLWLQRTNRGLVVPLLS